MFVHGKWKREQQIFMNEMNIYVLCAAKGKKRRDIREEEIKAQSEMI